MTKKTTYIIRALLFVSTVISLFFVPWPIVYTWILPLPDTVQEQLDQALEQGFDGMIVYIQTTNNEPEFYAAGWKNRESKIPADPHSLFKIASIGKLYTAVSVAKLAHTNQLSLDKSLAEYFPELAKRIEYADQITLRMMVQHRSGIPNYTNHPNYWANPPTTYEENLALALDLPAYFEPNSSYNYSNTNYLLIGKLIDKTLGYSQKEFIKSEILNPLGLTNTFFSLDEVDLNEVMSGYYVGYDADLKSQEMGMLATAEDVGIFVKALNDGSLLNEEEHAIYASIYKFEHGGLVPGYQSLAEYHKDIDTIIVQFMNTTDFKGYHWNISQIVHNRIAKILKQKKSIH